MGTEEKKMAQLSIKQRHNEKHFVRTMRGFKHITQTSLKRKLDLRVEMRCERGEDL